MAQEIVEVPITGKVTQIEVKEGDDVSEGDVLCMIESMKMENPVLSPVSGKVSGINISVGQTAEAGDTLATIEY